MSGGTNMPYRTYCGKQHGQENEELFLHRAPAGASVRPLFDDRVDVVCRWLPARVT
jgi:hypothetical protein